jgi:NADPH:quinone reductase-like Zn-dependent oxidoreductase
LKTKRGKTLLVFGASGGVGSLAVWLGARALGARIIGTARPDVYPYLRRLGATHAMDPHLPRGEAEIRRVAPNGFDAILATANDQSLLAFASHLRARAPIAYPNGVEPEVHVDGHPSIPFDGDMSLKNLQLLNRAIGKRAMPLRVEVFPLDNVVDAHRRIEQGHVVGKIVLRVRR